jgi:hypothetical protein
MPHVTQGLLALKAFMAKNGLIQTDCALALKVSNAAVHHWFESGMRPREPLRHGIKIWTRGEVDPMWWLTAEELLEIAHVKPFARASTKPPKPRAPRKTRQPRAAALRR